MPRGRTTAHFYARIVMSEIEPTNDATSGRPMRHRRQADAYEYAAAMAAIAEKRRRYL